MALRNVLDCSCDETVFTVKMTLLQRTRPFHSRLLMLMQSVAEIQLIILYIILLRKDSVKLKYFSQCWVLQTEKNISASHFKQVRMILRAKKIHDTVYVFFFIRRDISFLCYIYGTSYFENFKIIKLMLYQTSMISKTFKVSLTFEPIEAPSFCKVQELQEKIHIKVSRFQNSKTSIFQDAIAISSRFNISYL